MKKIKIKNIYFLRILRNLFVLIGILCSIGVILSFTTLPFWGYYWLGTSKSEITQKPAAIVLLGGSGMPSKSNLLRGWYTAQAAKSFPAARVIVAMPGDLSDSLSTPVLLKNELVLRNVGINRIEFENKGTNTRSQVLNCQGLLKMQSPVLVITSPEQMRRTILCFQKAGFEHVNALPAFEKAVDIDLSFNDDKLGKNIPLVPDVGKSINLRYQVWNHLIYEILFAREIAAMTYYKIRGWI